MRKRKTYEFDGKEYPYVYGQERADKLAELAETANAAHFEVGTLMKSALTHARMAGTALAHAKKIIGYRHHREWSKWRQEYFRGSKATSLNYMRVANKWDDPRVATLRETGVNVRSIEMFLNLLRGESLKQELPQPPDDVAEHEQLRQFLREMFANNLKLLANVELRFFEENFPAFWETMYGNLRESLCGALGYDPYEKYLGSVDERYLRRKKNESDKRRARRLGIEK